MPLVYLFILPPHDSVSEPTRQVWQGYLVRHADDGQPTRFHDGLDVRNDPIGMGGVLDNLGAQHEIEFPFCVEELGVLKPEFYSPLGVSASERGVSLAYHRLYDVDPKDMSESIVRQHLAVHAGVAADVKRGSERTNVSLGRQLLHD